MSAYELYIPAPRPTHNLITGQFLKGHTPHNKGKHWDEYMTARGKRHAAKGWKNLQTHRPKHRPDTAGRCRKKVVAITDDGKFRIFDYITPAAEWVGGSRENVGRCCRYNQSRQALHDTKGRQINRINTDHRYKGIRFYFYDDPVWWNKVKTTFC